jgi:large subunit ribosomal protein L27
MSTVKSAGVSKNLKDSNPQFLGVKLAAGQKAKSGSIIIRQRGTVYLPGKNVAVGKDHTIYSLIEGVVAFTERRKVNFDGTSTRRKVVSVAPVAAK